jgi:hypothetical protein
MAELFDAVTRANTILIDWSRDVWGYISPGLLQAEAKDGEVGSSTMPHKVNPIDFENAEGNFGLANALLTHLSQKLPISRWQRDLTDSTVLRNMGVALGYAVLGYDSLPARPGQAGAQRSRAGRRPGRRLGSAGRAIQTVMRRHGLPEPYEQLKAFTRGKPHDARADAGLHQRPAIAWRCRLPRRGPPAGDDPGQLHRHALTGMGFYNLNPKVMREPQKPQDGRLLKPVGENIASVIGHLERSAPDALVQIQEYLQVVVPMIEGVERKQIGPMETLEFRQAMAGAKHPWRFTAQNMSDGTLRALGVLTALFQRNPDHAPTLIGIEEPETALHPAASRALREALNRAAKHTQIIVTSHSPDLMDDPDLDADTVRAVIAEGSETHIAPLDSGSQDAMKQHLFSAGELLRLNQLAPDPENILAQQRQVSLFGEIEP